MNRDFKVPSATAATAAFTQQSRLLFLRDVYLAWIKYIVMSSRRRSIVPRRGHYWPPLSRNAGPKIRGACGRATCRPTRLRVPRDILGDVPGRENQG